MNIFILSTTPSIAASYHCDQHLNEMILESAQMICTALDIRGCFPYEGKRLGLYLPTHHNHPCTQWVAEHGSHVIWLKNLVHSLDQIRKDINMSQYSHSSRWVFDEAFEFYRPKSPEEYESSPLYFAEAITPKHIKDMQGVDTVTKYRLYYKWKKDNTIKHMSWKNRDIPEWINPAHKPTQMELI